MGILKLSHHRFILHFLLSSLYLDYKSYDKCKSNQRNLIIKTNISNKTFSCTYVYDVKNTFNVCSMIKLQKGAKVSIYILTTYCYFKQLGGTIGTTTILLKQQHGGPPYTRYTGGGTTLLIALFHCSTTVYC